MKYFLDTEFIEGFHKPLFGKRRHFIDLISIGIACEDGREYYAICNEFNTKDANFWVKENVLSKLPTKYAYLGDSPRVRREALLWKSLDEIKLDLINFFRCWKETTLSAYTAPNNTELYGYFAEYDSVVFRSIFGTMNDLPVNIPFYITDLKQLMDFYGLTSNWKDSKCPDPKEEHNALVDAKWNKSLYEAIINEPNTK